MFVLTSVLLQHLPTKVHANNSGSRSVLKQETNVIGPHITLRRGRGTWALRLKIIFKFGDHDMFAIVMDHEHRFLHFVIGS